MAASALIATAGLVVGVVPRAAAITPSYPINEPRVVRAVVQILREGSIDCTGSLVAPNIVLTAGHCFSDHVNKTNPPSDWESPNTWYTTNGWSGGNPVRAHFSVRMGANTASVDAAHTRTVASYSVPGSTDMLLFKLSTAFGADVATPIPVLTDFFLGEYHHYFAGDNGRLLVAGYGGGTVLKTGTGIGVAPPASGYNQCSQEPFICVTLQHGPVDPVVNVDPGDSGGPLYWVYPRTGAIFEIGELQGGGSGGDWHGTATMSPGAPANSPQSFGGIARPNLRTYLDKMAKPDQLLVGDVNADGKDDFVRFQPKTNVMQAFCSSVVDGKQNFLKCGNDDWEPVGVSDKARILTSDRLLLADATGDGRADLWVVNGPSVYLYRNDAGHAFVIGSHHLLGVHTPYDVPQTGDIDGDGCTDLIDFANDSTGDVYLLKSACGTITASPVKVHDFFGINGETPRVIDVTGDGKDDIVTFVQNANGHGNVVYVAPSTGTAFGASFKGSNSAAPSGTVPLVGLFNYGPYGDIATYNRAGGGTLQIGLYNPPTKMFDLSGSGTWPEDLTNGASDIYPADINGDGAADLIEVRSSDRRVLALWSNGSGFTRAAIGSTPVTL